MRVPGDIQQYLVRDTKYVVRGTPDSARATRSGSDSFDFAHAAERFPRSLTPIERASRLGEPRTRKAYLGRRIWASRARAPYSRFGQFSVRTLQMKLTIFHDPPERISDTASLPQWLNVVPLRNV